jgi:hypothetical protein
MSDCAVPMCSHQRFDGSSYYVDVDVDMQYSKYITVIITQTIMNIAEILPSLGLTI